ncbi:ionotropic receptor 21a-like [Scylla paramamosain]|uniref:ionotropic receptor 21a-like n=1 Tax=Scylla paramamosain TaxID=85552 RepID=UPI0030836736
MGETMRGETDISFANYFITADRLRIIDMTRPYYIDYTCFITPKPQPLPQYSAVAWPFTGMVWAVVLITLLIIPPVVLLTGLLEPGVWFQQINNAEFYVVGIFLNRAHPIYLVPTSSGLRVLVITNWIAAMVLAVAYKSSLIAFLTVPLQASPVNTLEELLSSGLDWGVRDRGGWDEWFSNSLDPTSRKIAEGFQYVEGIEGGLARVLEGNFAFMNSGTFLRYLIASSYTDEFGETKLHIAKQCFVPFRIGLGMPLFSIYTARFNDVVAKVVEAGLVSQWFKDLLSTAERKQRNNLKKNITEIESEPHLKKTMNLGLYHVQDKPLSRAWLSAVPDTLWWTMTVRSPPGGLLIDYSQAGYTFNFLWLEGTNLGRPYRSVVAAVIPGS